jgi:1,2-diacylglycerol 3-alpha-glucosyltransferase
MRVLHCCLAQFYIDNYGYQENILPKMHKLQGHVVMIVASTETFTDNMNLGYINASSYFTEYNVPIHRLPYLNWLPHFLARKLRIYKGLEVILEQFQPEIIFLHDVQFLSIFSIVNYAKRNRNCVIYADGHTDFINSARGWVSKNILHKIIYKRCAKAIEPYTKKFYGVLPVRVDFYKEVYKINPKKLELLVLGGDLTEIDLNKKEEIRKEIREQLDIKHDDLVVITGGKIDSKKNVHLLMAEINKIANDKIKLIVFGSVSEELKTEIEELAKSKYIRFIGWKKSSDISNYLISSDIAFFPGTHSVLWEQSAALGLPGVFKYWEGMQHMDIGGNCIYLKEITEKKIRETLLNLYNNPEILNKMTLIAKNEGMKYFSYFDIAKRAIEQ